jgi:hypothetical protein
MAYDFTLSLQGPQTAWRGAPVRLQVKSALTEGTRGYVDYTVKAPGVASFPVLSATCCGPSKGWQPADTDLVITVAADAPLGSQPVTLTAVSGGVTRTATFTLDVREMPQPNGFVPVSGKSSGKFDQWAMNMAQGRAACDANLAIHESQAWYYDGQRVFQQIAEYTGERSWMECADKSEALYRGYVLQNGGKLPGYRVFPHGLYRDFVETGDEESKRAVLLLASASAFASKSGAVDTVNSRETAFLLNARRLANKMGATHDLGFMAATALGHLDQWVRNRPYTQPFMMGLTMEALIGYHEDTGDGRVLQAIQPVLDLLWNEYWVPADKGFRYDDKATKGAPDLNMLIAPAFAWVYRMTGDVKYLERGDEIFNGGVAGAYLGQGKQFSQQYRWSFDYVKWVKPSAELPQEPESVSRDEFTKAIAALQAELQALREKVEQALTLDGLREKLR